MSPEYKSLREVANKLWYRFQDQLDDKQAGQGLFQEIRNVVEYFEMNKNPHTIEDLIKQIIEQFRSLWQSNAEMMDYRHIDEFIDDYEALRQQVRRLSNY